MEPTFNIPVPKQARELTRDQRLRIQILYNNAQYTISQIALQTGYSLRQICYALAHRLTP